MENVTKKSAIAETLESVFNQITSGVKNYIDWYGYKTAEVKYKDMIEPIGIGILPDSSAIKIFYIDKQYDKNDQKRFKQTFKIKASNNMWEVELAQNQLTTHESNFLFIACHIQIVHMIMQDIYSEYSTHH